MCDFSFSRRGDVNRFAISIFQCGLTTLVVAGVYFLILATSYMAPAGYYLQFDNILWLLFVFGVFLIMRDRHAEVVIVVLMTLLCGIVLSGVWRSGVSSHGLIAGVLPFSDAAGYVEGSLSLLYNGALSEWASRRPLSATIQAVLMLLCNGNLRVMLALLVFFSSVSMGLAIYEFYRVNGRIAGFIMFAGLFVFYRRFIGTALSEHMGVIYGCLAAAFVFRAIRTSQWKHGVVGLFLLSIGLLARAGAFFVLPLLAASLFFVNTTKKSVAKGEIVAAIVLAILVPFAMNKVIGTTLGNPNASMGNFSYTLYGLVSGGDWTQVLNDHPEIKAFRGAERYEKIYELAFERIKETPTSLIAGGFRAYRDYFFSVRGVYGFSLFLPIERFILEGTPASLTDERVGLIQKFFSQPWLYTQTAIAVVLFLGCNLLALIGVFSLLKEGTVQSKCFLFIAVGILASVPFVPPWDADWMRAYAATIPFVLVFPAMGILRVARFLVSFSAIAARSSGFYKRCVTVPEPSWDARRKQCEGSDIRLPMFAGLMFLMPLLGLLIFTVAGAPFVSNAQVISGSDHQLTFVRGSSIHLVDEVVSSLSTIRILPSSVERNMKVLRHGYPDRSKVVESLLEPGSVIALFYDVNRSILVNVIMRHEVWDRIEKPEQTFILKPVAGDRRGRWLQILCPCE